jgi:hypothetical protein
MTTPGYRETSLRSGPGSKRAGGAGLKYAMLSGMARRLGLRRLQLLA